MVLAALIVVAIVAVGALIVLDRQGKRAHAQLSEFASRIQHPDLISHKAALEHVPPEPDPSAFETPELYLAGQVLDGAEPDPEDFAPGPPS